MNVIYFLLIIIAVFAFYFLFLKKQGKLDFWKLISKNPDAAYEYFKDHPQTWKVLDSASSTFAYEQMKKIRPSYEDEWVGPFRLAVPSINKIIKIYGFKDRYEKDQDIIISKYYKPLKITTI